MPVDRLSCGGVMAFAQVRSRLICWSGRRRGPLPKPPSGRIAGDFGPTHGCSGEACQRRLPVTLTGVSGYHWP